MKSVFHSYFHQLSCGQSILTTQQSLHVCACVRMRVHFIRPCAYSHRLLKCLCSCVGECVCTPLMKLHLLLLILLLLMLSHFLWAPDKPTKQGENGALYWDACQDSPWIYGQQTVFITQSRKAEKRRGGENKTTAKEQCDPIFYLHIELLHLTGSIAAEGSLNYDANIMNIRPNRCHWNCLLNLLCQLFNTVQNPVHIFHPHISQCLQNSYDLGCFV